MSEKEIENLLNLLEMCKNEDFKGSDEDYDLYDVLAACGNDEPKRYVFRCSDGIERTFSFDD